VIILGDVDPKIRSSIRRNWNCCGDFVREKGAGCCYRGRAEHAAGLSRHAAGRHPADHLGRAGGNRGPGREALFDFGLTNGLRLRLTVWPAAPIFRFAAEDAENAASGASWRRFITRLAGYAPSPPPRYWRPIRTSAPAEPPAKDGRRTAPAGRASFVGRWPGHFFGFGRDLALALSRERAVLQTSLAKTINYLARSGSAARLHLDKQTPYRRNDPIRHHRSLPRRHAGPAGRYAGQGARRARRLRRDGDKSSENLETQTLQLSKVKNSRPPMRRY